MTLLTIATGLHGLPQWTRAEVEPLLIDNHDVLVEDLFVFFTNGFVLVGRGSRSHYRGRWQQQQARAWLPPESEECGRPRRLRLLNLSSLDRYMPHGGFESRGVGVRV